jgi:DMSO reductase family type II enzyme heme b subunit
MKKCFISKTCSRLTLFSILAAFAGILLAGIPAAFAQATILSKQRKTVSLDPADRVWNRAVSVPVTVSKVYEIGDEGGDMEDRVINVKSLHTATDIYFRLQWDDPSEDLVVNDVDVFADAIALEFIFGPDNAAGTSVRLPGDGDDDIEMGTSSQPVNIIFWRADFEAPRNITAGGLGTTHDSGKPPLPPDPDSQNIVHSQDWYNGSWTVIIKRPMDANPAGNQVIFSPGSTCSIAFAVWNGALSERNGRKFSHDNWELLDVR